MLEKGPWYQLGEGEEKVDDGHEREETFPELREIVGAIHHFFILSFSS
jgi:hypothetical protein